MRQVRIRWVDSCRLADGAWVGLDEIEAWEDDETICDNAGWIVRETPQHVYIAGAISPEEAGLIMKIPRVNIKYVEEWHGSEEASRLQGGGEEDSERGLFG